MRLLLFAGASSLIVFAAVLNLFPVHADPPPPPPTHVLQNQEDRDTRTTDQSAFLYGNASTSNAAPSSSNADTSNTPVSQGSPGKSPEPAAEPTPSGTTADITAEQEADFQALMPEAANELPRKVLTRTEAISQALSLNYDIRIKAFDEEVAQAQLRQAHGAFDPVLNAEGSYEDIRDPQNTQDFVATGGIPQEILNGMPRIFVENNQHYKIALDGKIPTGLQYEVKTQLDVLSNTLNETSPLSLFTPEYQSFTGITLDQPFLRGFGTDVNNSEIQAAIVNKMAVRYDVEDQMLSTVSQVLQSYFQLAYLTQELEAKREDRDLGIKLVRDRFLALEKGTISTREINHSESALAEIIEDYTKAENEVIDQQTVLQALLSSDESRVGKFVYEPTIRMTVPELSQTEDELVTYALLHRPKFLEAKERVEEENIKIVYAENQTWPQLDMKGTYGVNGLSASAGNSYYREVIPQGPQWSIGLAFSIPFGNNDAEGKLDEVNARKQQSILAMKQIELDTNLLIRKEVAIFHSDENRVRAMEVFARTADDNLGQEQMRQEKGLSSDLDVLKYQRDSTEAKARELAALADLNSAYVQIEETTGMLLDNLNIHIAPSP
jgi:outer membrane protein TolC